MCLNIQLRDTYFTAQSGYIVFMHIINKVTCTKKVSEKSWFSKYTIIQLFLWNKITKFGEFSMIFVGIRIENNLYKWDI